MPDDLNPATFPPGTRVRVTRGTYAAMIGMCVGHDDSATAPVDCVFVLLTFFGKPAVCAIDKIYLENAK